MSLAYIRILALRIHHCTLIWGIDTYVADQCTWKLLFVYNLKHSVEAKFDQSDTSWMHIPCDAYVSAWALQIYEARKITSMNECSTLFISTQLEINRINWPFIAKLKIPTHWNCEMSWLWFYCFGLHLITRGVFCCDVACCSFVPRVGEGQRWLDSKWVFWSHATMEVKEKARCVLEISEADLGEEVQ